MQQGIYCGAVDNSPNRDRVDVECAPIETLRLWVVVFNVRAKGKGCAMVKASNANDAEQILKTNGMYNGTQSEYLVTKIEEIITPPCCGLMVEQNVEFFHND